MAIAHRYNPMTQAYISSSEDFGNPPSNSASKDLPPRPWTRQWPRWTGKKWELIEDHRERKAPAFAPEDAQEATEYWLDGDTYETPSRKAFEPGPLPEGALLEKPKNPEAELLADAKKAKAEEISKAYDVAIAASITMPLDSPSTQDVALGAALFAAEDAEGLAFVQAQHQTRRAELLELLDAAQSTEEVEAIEVSYAV